MTSPLTSVVHDISDEENASEKSKGELESASRGILENRLESKENKGEETAILRKEAPGMYHIQVKVTLLIVEHHRI